MAKRSRQQARYEEDIEEYNDSSEEIRKSQKETQDLESAVGQVIRLVLGRELRSQFIKREHIVQALPNHRVNYDIVLKEAINILEEVYGLTLVQTPIPKQELERRTKITQSRTKPKQPYALVNCLKSESCQVLGLIWSRHIHDKVPNNRNTNDSQFFLPKYTKTASPIANEELVKTGIMLLIISLLILSENHLSEQELIRVLKSFGISENLNIKNSNYNLNLTELLNELIKKEYINKEILKGSSESDNVIDYTLGRRSLVEFTPESVFEYIKTIYEDKFDNLLAEKIIVTIERAYGVSLKLEDILEPDHQLEEHDERDSQNLPELPEITD